MGIMDTRVKKISKAVSTHDRELYAERDAQGMVHVYRRGWRYLSYDLDGQTLLVSCPNPFRVFSLTDNWTITGKPVDWGIEPIIARLKAIDIWNRPEVLNEPFIQDERDEKTLKRDLRNAGESFFKENRREFAKAFNDINTSTIDKSDPRRAYERKLENGYRK